jgi:hypothetical protein
MQKEEEKQLGACPAVGTSFGKFSVAFLEVEGGAYDLN